jgi:hypothetical protein
MAEQYFYDTTSLYYDNLSQNEEIMKIQDKKANYGSFHNFNPYPDCTREAEYHLIYFK